MGVTRGLLPNLSFEEEDADLGSTREEGRPRRTKRNVTPSDDGKGPLAALTCTNGRPMHTCDVVLATYEQIRRELQNRERCACWPHSMSCCVGVCMYLQVTT